MFDRLLQSGFIRSAGTFPDRPALEVAGTVLTYRELDEKARGLAWALPANHRIPLTAVFAYRSVTAFVGVLAALMRGHGYVPLNRTFPPERTGLMLDRSGCEAVIVDAVSASQLREVVAGIQRQLTLILPDTDDVAELAGAVPQHRIIGRRELEPAADRFSPVEVAPESLVYLLFTSGSTGAPKGVMVTRENVSSYVDYVTARYGITHEDRCSQMFDMTFDLSAHDIFVTWAAGACLCCPTQKTLIKPGQFVQDAGLTTWFSVPSTAVFMKKLGMLKPGMYPDLRLTLFCGEALPAEVMAHWAAAAPNSLIENIYGPTELTIACTAYRWDNATSLQECEHGIVPIGEPFQTMKALIVDEQLREVTPPSDGELLMTGPQLSRGYWQDPEKTNQAFVNVPGKNGVYYRTGDRVRRRAPGKPLVYLGRLDNQVKVLGHRVELGEIEAAVRAATGVDGVVAVGWPNSGGSAEAIEAFLEAESCDSRRVLDELKLRLPPYMVPRNLRLVRRFPLNANGKYDRKALMKTLESAN